MSQKHTAIPMESESVEVIVPRHIQLVAKRAPVARLRELTYVGHHDRRTYTASPEEPTPMVQTPRHAHSEPRELTPAEARWYAGKPAGEYAPRAESLLVPKGKYVAPATYDAVSLDYLIRTQNDDLATTYEEMVAEHMEAISLQREADDELAAFDLTEADLDGTVYELPDQRTRRLIEWEQAEAHNGPVYRARPWDDHGQTLIRATVNGRAPRDDAEAKAARAVAKATYERGIEAWQANQARDEYRARAAFYGPQWRLSLLTPRQRAIFDARMALDLYSPDPDPYRYGHMAAQYPPREQHARDQIEDLRADIADIAIAIEEQRARNPRADISRLIDRLRALQTELATWTDVLAQIRPPAASPAELGLDLDALD